MTHWKVALPMYNIGPTLTAAYEGFLQSVIAALQLRGWQEPIELLRDIDDPERFWLRPDLLLSQTCGYPLTTALKGRVSLLGTPQYDAPGCEGFAYRSVLVVRADGKEGRTLAHFRGAVGAVNQWNSHSGMNALRHTVAPLARDGRFFEKVLLSGSHLASLALVQSGAADLAAIDCITFACIAEHDPAKLAGLGALQTSNAAPGLPLIGSLQLSATQTALLVEVLESVCADAQIAKPLHITGFARSTWQDYQAVQTMERQALALGYSVVN